MLAEEAVVMILTPTHTTKGGKTTQTCPGKSKEIIGKVRVRAKMCATPLPCKN